MGTWWKPRRGERYSFCGRDLATVQLELDPARRDALVAHLRTTAAGNRTLLGMADDLEAAAAEHARWRQRMDRHEAVNNRLHRERLMTLGWTPLGAYDADATAMVRFGDFRHDEADEHGPAGWACGPAGAFDLQAAGDPTLVVRRGAWQAGVFSVRQSRFQLFDPTEGAEAERLAEKTAASWRERFAKLKRRSNASTMPGIPIELAKPLRAGYAFNERRRTETRRANGRETAMWQGDALLVAGGGFEQGCRWESASSPESCAHYPIHGRHCPDVQIVPDAWWGTTTTGTLFQNVYQAGPYATREALAANLQANEDLVVRTVRHMNLAHGTIPIPQPVRDETRLAA